MNWNFFSFRRREVFCRNSFTFQFRVRPSSINVLCVDSFLDIGFIYLGILSFSPAGLKFISFLHLSMKWFLLCIYRLFIYFCTNSVDQLYFYVSFWYALWRCMDDLYDFSSCVCVRLCFTKTTPTPRLP